MLTRLHDRYQKEIHPKLMTEYQVGNVMSVPRIKKIVINIGAGDAKDNQGILDKILVDLTALSGQKPVVTKSKSSIAGFKVGKGQSIGAMVTLRGKRMYEFLDKLITVSLPKVRDFRGLSDTAFDNQGNYTLGLREQSIFPEIVFTSQSKTTDGKIRGLEITVVTTADSKEKGRRLLELLGMPFKKS